MSEDAELPNNPSFVFLQLFHSAALSLPPCPGHLPLLLSGDEVRSLMQGVSVCMCRVSLGCYTLRRPRPER